MTSGAETAPAGADPKLKNPRHATAEEVAWERKYMKIAGGSGAVAGVLLLISFFLKASALKSSSSDADKVLRVAHRHASDLRVVAVLEAVSIVLTVIALLYLWRAARNRADVARVIPVLLLVGGLAVGILNFMSELAVVSAAKDFVNHPIPHPNLSAITDPHKYANAVEDLAPKKHAENVVRDHFSNAEQLSLYFVNLIWGAGLALTSLVGMRTGLLSRFLGVLGLIVGVLYAVPLLGGGGGLLQFLWYLAVGLVISNVWPGGRGPAWDAGAPVRWPGAAEKRLAMQGGGAPAPSPSNGTPPDEEAEPSARAQRRKRKKRGSSRR
jgi:Domain of unknown function (DUF4386)